MLSLLMTLHNNPKLNQSGPFAFEPGANINVIRLLIYCNISSVGLKYAYAHIVLSACLRKAPQNSSSP